MGKVAIQAVNLGKQYRIGHTSNAKQTLSEAIGATARMPVQMLRDLARGQNPFRPNDEDLIWALKDVSFDVEQGEVLGVIGRNGAGKSTLLKILTRITNPTSGYARIRGRVGSLLEVGTGFHQELTGRENAYMSGAILGMRRVEIDRKFDEIVAFSGVERFIDTPVKRYSSGMYLRLAFAVAAHLQPDVLLVDEVLAVGDAEFQQKCLGKMGNAAQEGRTVLFVSHNLNAVKTLCERVIWLDNGRVKQIGGAAEVVSNYLGVVKLQSTDPSVFPAVNQEYGLGIANCQASILPHPDDELVDLQLVLTVTSNQMWPRIGIGFSLTTETGVMATLVGAQNTGFLFDVHPGSNRYVIHCPNINYSLAAGDYTLSLWLVSPGIKQIIKVDTAAAISVPGVDFYHSGRPFEARATGPAVLPHVTCRSEEQ
jgi:lipopolysaccharide transport system ATP-binding protein